MNQREKLIGALKGEIDYLPFDIDFNFVAKEKYRENSKQDFGQFFGLGQRFIPMDYHQIHEPGVFAKYYEGVSLPEGTDINDFGVGLCYQNSSEQYFHPMRNLTTLSELEEYPFPFYDDERYFAGFRAKVESCHEAGIAAIGMLNMTIFPISWMLRSMEETFCDIALESEFTEMLYGMIYKNRAQIAEGMARCGADILSLGDDVATQDRLMMSMEKWRKWIKPGLKKAIQGARAVNPDILVYFHCCGYATPLIDDLIEIGVNILNPLQPESVDLEYVAKRYCGQIGFWGGISTQNVLPHGTPDEVCREAERVAALFRSHGGRYVLCPSHSISEDIPWENVLALHRAYEKIKKGYEVE